MSSSSLRHIVFIAHPVSFLPAIFAVGLTLNSTPPALNIITILTLSRLFLHITIYRAGALLRLVALWLSLTFSIAGSHLVPSLHALSTPASSIAVLALYSGFSSAVVVACLSLDRWMFSRVNGIWVRVALFPALWAHVMAALAWASPVGRLISWTPTTGFHGYMWLTPYFGQVGKDWIIAGWVIVISEVVGLWVQGAPAYKGPKAKAPRQATEDLLSMVDAPEIETESISSRSSTRTHSSRSSRSSLSDAAIAKLYAPEAVDHSPLILFLLLCVLTIPSFVMSTLPLPAVSESTTPLSVGCILPVPKRTVHGGSSELTFDDYLRETVAFSNRAHVLLWPEGAAKFASPSARIAAFEEVKSKSQAPMVAVAFEEWVPSSDWEDSDSTGAHNGGMRRTGLALLRRNKEDVLYYKQHLVPVAESFSLSPSPNPPTITMLEVAAPRGVKKHDWNPTPPFTRPIPVTAAICLDFAFPDLFSRSSFPTFDPSINQTRKNAATTRSALILAPAHTWHTAVGTAMFAQARARAAEVGSTLLWCDGGDGGVSSVVSPNEEGIHRVGAGSWVQDIGIQWEFDSRRTVYGRGGEWFALLMAWSTIIVGWVVGKVITSFDGPKERTVEDDGSAGLGAKIASNAAGLALSGQTGVQTAIGSMLGGVRKLRGFLPNSARPTSEGERQPLLVDV